MRPAHEPADDSPHEPYCPPQQATASTRGSLAYLTQSFWPGAVGRNSAEDMAYVRREVKEIASHAGRQHAYLRGWIAEWRGKAAADVIADAELARDQWTALENEAWAWLDAHPVEAPVEPSVYVMRGVIDHVAKACGLPSLAPEPDFGGRAVTPVREAAE